MRVALAQQSYTVGHFEANIAKMVEAIDRAKADGAQLAVFPELAVCGYSPHDLLEREEFLRQCGEAVRQVAAHAVGISVIVGAPGLPKAPTGKRPFNSAYLLSDGKVAGVHHKSHLPRHDIFDDYRHFEPNPHQHWPASVGGSKIAITLGEDLHTESLPGGSSPVERLPGHRPELIVNIAASPFSHDDEENRLAALRSNAARHGVPVVYVNQVGGSAELLFDGGSMVLNGKGEVAHRLKSFEEELLVVDTNQFKLASPPPVRDEQQRIERIHDALVMGIRDYFGKMGFTQATLGLSGGIDSAVVLALAQRALGSGAIRVLLMPSRYSSQHSVDDAVALAKTLNIRYDIVGIEPLFDAFKNQLNPIFGGLEENIAEENIQARARGTLLMALSNKFGHLLLNTSNKSEAAVGYGTLYGDMNGAIGVLGDVYKTDVYRLAAHINRHGEVIPSNTIAKPPSAELRPNQKDSDSLPPYDTLDAILFAYIERQLDPPRIAELGFDPATVSRVVRLVNASEHKRFQAPPVLRVSSRAFGSGRRMPLVAKW